MLLRLERAGPLFPTHGFDLANRVLDSVKHEQRRGVARFIIPDRLEGCEVECPLHASRFNLRTGAVDAPPAKLPVRTHRVDVEDDTIYVTLSDEAPNLPPGVSAGASGGAP